MEIYITEMLRWGKTETHHYVVGAFSTKELAEAAGDVEKSWRGGKYEYKVILCIIDDKMPEKKLKHHSDCT